MSEDKIDVPVVTALSEAVTREKRPDVLVVDDDPMILDLLGKVLKKRGFRAVLANNGKDAVNLVRKTTPDVILLDIKMPGMDGVAVLKEIRAFDPDVEVIIMTGFASLDSAVEGLRYGAFDYIQKPFNGLDEVVNAIRQAGERRSPCPAGRSREVSTERKIYNLKVLCQISRDLAGCSGGKDMLIQLLNSLSGVIRYDVAISLWTELSKQTKLLMQAVTPCSLSFVEEAKRNLIETFNSTPQRNIPMDITFDKILGEENIRQEEHDDLRTAKKVKSFLNVPLMNHRKVTGMINFSSRFDRSFTSGDVHLIHNAFSQMRPALDKVNRVEAAQESEIERLLERMPEGLVMINEDFQVTTVNKMAQDILRERESTLESIQRTLGLDLRKFKADVEKGNSDLIRKDVKIHTESCQILTSLLKGKAETFRGFMISIRKLGKEIR